MKKIIIVRQCAYFCFKVKYSVHIKTMNCKHLLLNEGLWNNVTHHWRRSVFSIRKISVQRYIYRSTSLKYTIIQEVWISNKVLSRWKFGKANLYSHAHLRSKRDPCYCEYVFLRTICCRMVVLTTRVWIRLDRKH